MARAQEGRDGIKDPAGRGPWDALPLAKPARRGRLRRLLRFAGAAVILLDFGAYAYRELSRPEAWAYWKDLYLAPSLSTSLLPGGYDDDGRRRAALMVYGEIGAAAAHHFREAAQASQLSAGDVVFLSSPGRNVDQALIMGEIIRARGLTTAVGRSTGNGAVRPSFCASACVFAFAGGSARLGVSGSALGIHRFTSTGEGLNTVADTADYRPNPTLHAGDGRLAGVHRGDVGDRFHPLADDG